MNYGPTLAAKTAAVLTHLGWPEYGGKAEAAEARVITPRFSACISDAFDVVMLVDAKNRIDVRFHKIPQEPEVITENWLAIQFCSFCSDRLQEERRG